MFLQVPASQQIVVYFNRQDKFFRFQKKTILNLHFDPVIYTNLLVFFFDPLTHEFCAIHGVMHQHGAHKIIFPVLFEVFHD